MARLSPCTGLRVTLRRLRSLLEFPADDMATPKLATVVATEIALHSGSSAWCAILDILAAAIPQNAIEADPALARVRRGARHAELEGARAISRLAPRLAAATLDLLLFTEADEDEEIAEAARLARPRPRLRGRGAAPAQAPVASAETHAVALDALVGQAPAPHPHPAPSASASPASVLRRRSTSSREQCRRGASRIETVPRRRSSGPRLGRLNDRR